MEVVPVTTDTEAPFEQANPMAAEAAADDHVPAPAPAAAAADDATTRQPTRSSLYRYADPLDPAAALTDRGVYLSEDALRQSMLVADHDDALSDCDFESAHGGDEEDAHEARAASARKLTRNDSHRSEEAEKDKQPVSWSSYLFGTW